MSAKRATTGVCVAAATCIGPVLLVTTASAVAIKAQNSGKEGSAAQTRVARRVAGYVVGRPENPWGHYMYGLSAWKSGQHERAMEGFDQVLWMNASFAELAPTLGILIVTASVVMGVAVWRFNRSNLFE